jgi:hypothetical protein
MADRRILEQQLVTYLEGAFARRAADLARLHSTDDAYLSRAHEILRKANFFHLELTGFHALAKGLYADAFQESVDAVRIQHAAEGDRRPVESHVKAQAKREVAWLEDAVLRVENMLELCQRVGSSAQTMGRTVAEGLIERGMPSNDDAWDDYVPAPSRLEVPAASPAA